ACLIRGPQGSGSGVAGELVVAKGDQWRALEQQYYSDAGYLGLLDVNADGQPDLASAQYYCSGSASQCSNPQVYLRVFKPDGTEIGCGNYFPRLSSLTGWPNPRVRMGDLSKCE